MPYRLDRADDSQEGFEFMAQNNDKDTSDKSGLHPGERVTGEDLLYEEAAAPDELGTSYKKRSAFTRKGAGRAKVARPKSEPEEKAGKHAAEKKGPAEATFKPGALTEDLPDDAQGKDTQKADEEVPKENPYVTVGKDGKAKIDLDRHAIPKLHGKAKRREVLVAVFAVVIGVSMMLPSLSYIFAGASGSNSQDTQTSSDASQAANDENASNQPAADTQTATSMEAVDSQYQSLVAPLESDLQNASDDTAKLSSFLGLGDDYSKWGTAATQFATDDASEQHVIDLFNKAIDYYNQYLAINDSDAVRVKVAQCTMFSGKVDEGLASLEAMTQKNPDYAPAYVYMGIGYAAKGDMTKAVNTFKLAEEKDPDDKYGAKTLAQNYEAYLAYYTQQQSNANGNTDASGNASGSANGNGANGSNTGTDSGSATDGASGTNGSGTGMGALVNQLNTGAGTGL